MTRPSVRACRSGVASVALAFAAAAPAFAGAGATSPTLFCTGAINCADPSFVGAVTPTSAAVWVHLTADASVRVRYEDVKKRVWMKSASATTAAASGDTASFALAGLTASTTYAYQVGITQADGSETWSASSYFRTGDATPKKVAFSVLTDFSNKLKGSPAMKTAAQSANNFVVFIGDMDHRNPASQPGGGLYPPGSPAVLADMRNMHQNMRNPDFAIGADFYDSFLSSTSTHPQTPFYYAWDDHDYCANNEGDDCPTRDIAFQTYRENYLWAADSAMNPDTGCQSDFQRISFGKLVDVFVLDARSDRDLLQSPPTMLGSCQRGWLLAGLANSKATWKFVMSPVPFNPTTKTYDAWGAFPAERQQVLDQIATAKIKNVVFLSGDIHSGGAYDDGTHSGVPEFSVPHANMPDTWVDTYCQPIYDGKHFDHLNVVPGTWSLGTLTAPNTSPVPTCLGTDYPGATVTQPDAAPFPLSGVGSPGYARVEVTATTATVTVYGYDGTVRQGVHADGSAAPLSMAFTAK